MRLPDPDVNAVPPVSIGAIIDFAVGNRGPALGTA
jgi:hypothetical protein